MPSSIIPRGTSTAAQHPRKKRASPSACSSISRASVTPRTQPLLWQYISRYKPEANPKTAPLLDPPYQARDRLLQRLREAGEAIPRSAPR